MRALPRMRGFTLVEVLVALSVMAVMAVMTWRGVDGMVRARHATQAATGQALALQTGLAQWRADLDAMMVWPVAATAPQQPDKNAAVRSLHWDGRVLRITRQVAGQPQAGLLVAAWTRHPVSGQWLRWQSAPVLSVQGWHAAWQQAAHWAGSAAAAMPRHDTDGAHAVAVVALQDWQLHYFRRNGWSNPLSSGSEGEDDADTLPDGVRLTLSLASGQHLAGDITLDWVRPDFGEAQ